MRTSTYEFKTYRSRFVINKGCSFFILNVNEIAFIFLNNECTYAVNFKKEKFLLNAPMCCLETELNPKTFKRVNRQTIINLNSIHIIEPYFNGRLIIKTEPDCPNKIIVSRSNSKSLMNWIDQ